MRAQAVWQIEKGAQWNDKLLSEVPLLVLAAVFLFVFFHHLTLFLRRRQRTEHLWFGVLSLAFSINTIASTAMISHQPETSLPFGNFIRAPSTNPANHHEAACVAHHIYTARNAI